MVCLEIVIPMTVHRRQDRSDAMLRLLLLAVTAKYRFSFGVLTQGATCTVMSTDISIILELLPKSTNDALCNSKFLKYFYLKRQTFQVANNSTT
ncbi:hypothetical protein TNCV_4709391 [Trichonephila clavipes]|nr:hypothetical protein TNCV_4709391 [Trichonephila clavipes]